MHAPHPAYPLVVELPELGNYPHSVRALYVPGSSPPQYTVHGEPCAIDVVIPDDLAAAGWYWLGSLLCWPESDPLRPQGIATCTYPPPGWCDDRETCFDLARQSERHRAEWRERRVAERVAKVTKQKPPKADAPAPAAVQMELF
jgi:hypothetical protein